MLEVAVIGAGTSGIVAARQLILAGLRPVIFEVANKVGGAWTPSSVLLSTPTSEGVCDNPAGKMWNGMHTNLSKYTCRFSDWPWPEDASTFPSVEEMHDYLESYSDSFLTASPACSFQLECKVINVEQLESPSTKKEDAHNYKVEWTDLNTKTTHSRDFGGVVVATGFFRTPRWPSFLKKHVGNEIKSDNTSNNKPQLMHSSEYRTHHAFKDKSVAVIGSSFSALEIAADISRSAGRVVSVVPSIPWILPRWVPTLQPMQTNTKENADEDSTTMTVLPVDLALYQRTHAYPKITETISLNPESCRERHQHLQALVGHKQHQSPLGEPTNWEEPPFVAISDKYLDLVRECKIEVVHGRLVGVDEDDGTLQIGDTQTTASSDNAPAHSTVLNDIDHVICCTGYSPQLHDFLSSRILSATDYSPDDSFCPMTLAWDTLHPSLPGLAFCGMYRGPYMGIMELQARLAAGVMSGTLSLEEEQIESALKNSEIIRHSTPRAQFPHFDYPGFMDTLSHLCYEQRDCPKYNTNVGDMVVPTFYQPDGELSEKCQSDIQTEIQHGQDGRRMPKVVLQSILGNWSFDRNIVHLQTRKVERVYGTVKFSKYWERSSPENDSDNVDEMFISDTTGNPVLYREDGLYELTPTQKFEVFREYEYECKHDELEIYFVEGGKRTYLFLSLKFVPEATNEQTSSNDDGYWVKATSDHLCIKDLYSATFRVKLNGLSASEIIIKYRVKGPSKDYESTTVLKPAS